jgi:hypothetical protein
MKEQDILITIVMKMFHNQDKNINPITDKNINFKKSSLVIIFNFLF